MTHYQKSWLSMIDSGTSRIAIWKKNRMETAVEIARVLNKSFWIGGLVDKVLIVVMLLIWNY